MKYDNILGARKLVKNWRTQTGILKIRENNCEKLKDLGLQCLSTKYHLCGLSTHICKYISIYIFKDNPQGQVWFITGK